MKLMRTARRLAVLLGIAYAVELATLKPSPAELASLQFYLEAPIRMTMRRLTTMMPWLYSRYGEMGVKGLQYVFYQVGLDRAELLARELRIDRTDARSLGRVLDFEDGLAGVRGTWTEECRGRAVKEERYCPGARELARCPEVCTCLMMAMEAGTFAVIDAKLKVPQITKLLSRGDDCCLAVIELEETERPEERSPQATGEAFPPVLKVPGLQFKLAVTGFKSLARAAFTLITSGPDQPMKWYEFFRYAPE